MRVLLGGGKGKHPLGAKRPLYAKGLHLMACVEQLQRAEGRRAALKLLPANRRAEHKANEVILLGVLSRIDTAYGKLHLPRPVTDTWAQVTDTINAYSYLERSLGDLSRECLRQEDTTLAWLFDISRLEVGALLASAQVAQSKVVEG